MSAVKNWILVNFLGTNDLNRLEITGNCHARRVHEVQRKLADPCGIARRSIISPITELQKLGNWGQFEISTWRLISEPRAGFCPI